MPKNYSGALAEYSEGIAEYAMSLFPEGFKGICVDVGAYDPIWLSNSWLFEQAGWDCYCIEPNPRCIPRLKKHRKNVYEYACSDKNEDDATLFVYSSPAVGEAAGTGLIEQEDWYSKTLLSHQLKVKVRTLDWLVENELNIDHIDYLTIDVERGESAVLRGTDLARWQPKILVVENLEYIPEQNQWIVDRGYRYVHRIVYNDIYIQLQYYVDRLVYDDTVKSFVYPHNWAKL